MTGLTGLIGLVSIASVVGGENSIRATAVRDSEPEFDQQLPASLSVMADSSLNSRRRSHHRNRNYHGNHDSDSDGNGSGGDSAFHESGSGVGVFDFYVFSMTYQPEFCREHSNAFAGCHSYDEDWEGSLTIHGLWPQFDDGTWPSSCTNEAFDSTLEQNPTLATQLEKRWPNIKSLSPQSRAHSSFWEHEWSKHGTCSGLSQEEYFESALGLFLPTPESVSTRYGHKISRDALLEAYGGEKSAVAICNFRNESFEDQGVGYLSEVRFCFEKNVEEGGAPGGRMMECPDTVLNEGSCGELIKIASFSDTTAQS